MLYPRIVAFDQYGRGLEGLAQRSTYRARWCARGPGALVFSPHPNSSESDGGAVQDVITAANGQPAHSVSDLVNILEDVGIGTPSS
jgi:S1-C subfamily serine protease